MPIRKPGLSLVLSSPHNGVIGFGNTLPYDMKEFLGAAIHDDYDGAGSLGTGAVRPPGSGRWGGGR
jgi:hypothetical protein